MSEKGIRELAKEKFACSQCRGSRRVVTIGGIEAECKACRGFGTWGITIEEIAAFAESIVEQCAKVADEHADRNRQFAEGFDKRDQQVMVDRALANKAEAERIAKDIRSRWQRREGQ